MGSLAEACHQLVQPAMAAMERQDIAVMRSLPQKDDVNPLEDGRISAPSLASGGLTSLLPLAEGALRPVRPLGRGSPSRLAQEPSAPDRG